MTRTLVLCALIAAWSHNALAQHAEMSTGTREEFRGLHAANQFAVWATGRNGVFARSTDGIDWQADSIAGATGFFLVDVHAMSAETACVLGTDFNGGLARVFHTTDGGRSWTVTYQKRQAGVFFDGMAFWDDQRGVAFSDPVDGAFLIIRTSDGCRSWSEVPPSGLPAPFAAEAGFAASGMAITTLGSEHAWIGTGGGAFARVLRTNDGGLTWSAHQTPLPGGQTAGIFGIAFRDTLHGIAVGGDYQQPTETSANVLRTDDGGVTWVLIGSSEPAGVRYGVTYVPETDPPVLIAVGPSGYGYSFDDGETWQLGDTASVNTTTFVGPRAGWAAGVGGRVLKLVVPRLRR